MKEYFSWPIPIIILLFAIYAALVYIETDIHSINENLNQFVELMKEKNNVNNL